MRCQQSASGERHHQHHRQIIRPSIADIRHCCYVERNTSPQNMPPTTKDPNSTNEKSPSPQRTMRTARRTKTTKPSSSLLSLSSSSTTSIPYISTKQTSTPLGAFFTMLVCAYCLLIAPTFAIVASEIGDFRHHSSSQPEPSPASQQSRNDIFSLGETIPLIYKEDRFYNSDRNQLSRQSDNVERRSEKGSRRDSNTITNLLTNQRGEDEAAGDLDIGANDNIYNRYNVWNEPSTLLDNNQVGNSYIINQVDDDDDVFNADDIDQLDQLIGDDDLNGRLTTSNYHKSLYQKPHNDHHHHRQHEKHSQEHGHHHEDGHLNNNKHQRDHKKRRHQLHLIHNNSPQSHDVDNNVAINEFDERQSRRDQQHEEAATIELNRQVPEQSPIVVSSSDNSYVSASPIISNEIISTTATTTSSSSSSSGSRSSRKNTNRGAGRRKRRRRRKDGTTIASNNHINQGYSTVSDYSIIDTTPAKTSNSDQFKETSTRFDLHRSAPVILGNFRASDHNHRHDDRSPNDDEPQSLYRQIENEIDIDDGEDDDDDDEIESNEKPTTPRDSYSPSSTSISSPLPFNQRQDPLAIDVIDGGQLGRANSFIDNNHEFYTVDRDDEAKGHSGHSSDLIVDASSQARYSNVKTLPETNINNNNNNRLSSLLPVVSYGRPSYYDHDDSRLASIEIEQEEPNDYNKGGLNSAIIAIMFGIAATGMLIMVVGHKMNSIRRRAACKGRRCSLVPDTSDFLIQTIPI